MSAKFRTKFNSDWLKDSAFVPWLHAVPNDPYRAGCTVSCKTFDLSNMGRQAVVSHKAGLKHQRNSSSSTNQNMLTFAKVELVPKSKDTPTEEPTMSTGSAQASSISANTNVAEQPASGISSNTNVAEQPAKVRKELYSFLNNDSITEAEVLWCLQIIAKHQSYRSCDKLRELFHKMFSDSGIAKKFTLSPTKASYVIT